jgi:hypothetical protein
MKRKPDFPRKANRSARPTFDAPKYVFPARTAYLTATLTCVCNAVVQHEFPWAFGAFEETASVLCKLPCPSCGAKHYTKVNYYHPPIDEEILTVWSRYTDVCFSSQDEDLLLASAEYLPWIEQLIDDPWTHPWKRSELIGAMETLIFNTTKKPHQTWTEAQQQYNDPLRERAIAFLKPRIATGMMQDNGHWGYIAKVVYPQLGVPLDPQPFTSVVETPP